MKRPLFLCFYLCLSLCLSISLYLSLNHRRKGRLKKLIFLLIQICLFFFKLSLVRPLKETLSFYLSLCFPVSLLLRNLSLFIFLKYLYLMVVLQDNVHGHLFPLFLYACLCPICLSLHVLPFSLYLLIWRRSFIYTFFLSFFKAKSCSIHQTFYFTYLYLSQYLISISQPQKKRYTKIIHNVSFTNLPLFLKAKFGASSEGAIRRCLWNIW